MSQDIRLPSSYPEALLDGFSTEHARKVAACTAGFVALGGLSGSAIAAYKYAPAIPAAFNSALTTVGPAFAFFSLREYVAVPTFAYLRATGSVPQNTSLRLRNIPETGTAGFATGAVLGLYHFGSPVRAVSGGFTFAFFACSAQLAFNQLNVLRVNYIKRQARPVQEWSKELGELDAPRPEAMEEKPPLTQRMTEAVLSVTPIRKVSNEEYAETLKTRIQKSEQELSIVKRQMQDIQEQLDHAHEEKQVSV